MRLDKKLNLVIPVDRDDGSRVFVHSTPVSYTLFDLYWEPVGKTFAEIYGGGYNVVAGPRIAAKMLRKVSTEMRMWDTKGGVQQGLLAEVHRLTMVLVPGEKGWQQIPFDQAVSSKLLEPQEIDEVEGAVCFFTVASLTHRKADLPSVMEGAAKIWDAQIVSLSSTEFMNSLPISTADANSSATAPA